MPFHDRDSQTFHCPHCDAVVKVGARVCRSCGATDDCGWNSDGGWNDDADFDTDADDDFDYDDFVAREFPEHADPAALKNANRPWLPIVVLALIVTLLFSMFVF
ncbi:zinc ribbon domain-containing protein [Fuerstiella marisgermanici]|uniref:Putative zinc-ribbon domain-containing protein n=1 Tax=Fuerstiella marisgermanici TaxID=1891926 RepID=A0A1P8WI25_9PLAN|nr:zinc ribbon domain-containing protein [Fuerstiella marisgermanici]APZ93701.1 hypothetical protein Fuma_03319 [Fuerstiella marisgermanici]